MLHYSTYIYHVVFTYKTCQNIFFFFWPRKLTLLYSGIFLEMRVLLFNRYQGIFILCSIAIILMGKRELVALLNLSSWCLVMVERLFLTVPRGCLRFVIVVFPDHTHYFIYGTLEIV